MTTTIKARILIISDTHALQLKDTTISEVQAANIDVLIHCGDLTEHSKLSEFREAIRLIQRIDAPLKLVIPGNHDFSLDDEAFGRMIAEARRLSADEDIDDLLTRDYGTTGDAQRLWEGATNGIKLLNEGNHVFTLKNGAQLNVYASPYTPSTNEWGFQYSSAHNFNIDDNIDIAITHGPPKGIMDRTLERKRIGCPMLFRAVAKAQPRIHCFGHVHQGWGARLITWRPDIPDEAVHFDSIDNEKSMVLETLASLRGGEFETPAEAQERVRRVDRYRKQGYCDLHCYAGVDLCPERTLFVNAALKGDEELDQLPWLVDIELQANEPR